MNQQNSYGKKIAVLVESQYIPEEISVYREKFTQSGFTVDFVSRLWNQPKATFVGEVENPGQTPETLEVDIDLQHVSLDDYSAVIMAANYTSVRLRYFEPEQNRPVTADMVKSAPAVQFFAKAMKNPNIIKGALCHGLWILTPNPELLRGRRVICHNVVLADVANAGGIYVDDPSGVVTDGDLVTGRSFHEAGLLVDRIMEQMKKVEEKAELSVSM